MKATFWGVRGSLPVPAPHVARYGGNTPCVEISAGNGSILIDAGTGIRAAGETLLARGQTETDLLLSHTHWDHIQGLPHFPPLYRRGHRLTIRGPSHPGRPLGKILSQQQDPAFFPVPLEEAQAEVRIEELEHGDSLECAGLRVTCRRLNHPGKALGFRLEAGGRTAAYLCDVDLAGDLLLGEGMTSGPAAAEGQWREQLEASYRDLAHLADLLICDTFFTPEEYQPDWGHSRIDDALRLAPSLGVRRLALFHHQPQRTDEELAILLAECRDQAPAGLEVVAAAEGMELVC
jgi:phosphoribosyl 1,2-cyclic phosphodiesterase